MAGRRRAVSRQLVIDAGEDGSRRMSRREHARTDEAAMAVPTLGPRFCPAHAIVQATAAH